MCGGRTKSGEGLCRAIHQCSVLGIGTHVADLTNQNRIMFSLSPSCSEKIRSNFTSIIFLRYFDVNAILVSLKLLKLFLLFKQSSASVNIFMNCYAFLPLIPIKKLKMF
jgi:hypothetical protein